MQKIEINKLKKDDELFLNETDKLPYVLDYYSKPIKRFVCYLKGDISEIEHVKKRAKVYINK